MRHAQHVAERHGFTRFVSMQNYYSLMYREDERRTTRANSDASGDWLYQQDSVEDVRNEFRGGRRS